MVRRAAGAVIGLALLAMLPGACTLLFGDYEVRDGTSGSGGAPASSTSNGATGGASASSSTTTGTSSSSGTIGSSGAGASDGGLTFASCNERHTAMPTDPSGVYLLVPAAGAPYQAYCDMSAPGGGWTLALKIDGNKTTFAYDSHLWEDTTALSPDHPDLDMTEAKLASFWSVPFSAMRVGMVDGGTTRWGEILFPSTSLQALFAFAGEYKTTQGNAFWEGLLASGSMQTTCNREGVNVDGRVRLGIIGDESMDCQSPDSVIGFGALATLGPPSGNYATFGPDHGDRMTKTFGYVLVR